MIPLHSIEEWLIVESHSLKTMSTMTTLWHGEQLLPLNNQCPVELYMDRNGTSKVREVHFIITYWSGQDLGAEMKAVGLVEHNSEITLLILQFGDGTVHHTKNCNLLS